jgi:hypothetical protein
VDGQPPSLAFAILLYAEYQRITGAPTHDMSERPKPKPFAEKLTAAVAGDFPEARDVLVSFPDEWQLVRSFRRADTPLYAAAWPWETEKPRRDHFYGLSEEINLSLNRYRFAQLFRPWPQPVIRVAWDAAAGEGRVVPGGHLDIRLEPIAQAQVWSGETYAVLWECFVLDSSRREEWQDELIQFWHTVEEDMGVSKIFTLPRDPAYPTGYTEILSELGYQPDTKFSAWWSREL